MVLGREKGFNQETNALNHFKDKGWKLLERNYVCRFGEIDLIFKSPENAVVFMEVKYRNNSAHGFAQETVNRSKQQKIIKTALHFIKEFSLDGCDFRFDVAALDPQGLTHIPNAFPASGYTL